MNSRPGRTTFEDWSQSLFGLFPLKGKATRYHQRSHKSATGTPTGPSGLAYVIWKRIHKIAEIAGFAEPMRQFAASATEVVLNEKEQGQLKLLETSVEINDPLYLAAREALRAYRLKLFLELSINGIFKKIPGIGSAGGYQLLLSDFKNANGNVSLIGDTWTEKSSAIVQIAQTKTKDSLARKVLALYDNLRTDAELRKNLGLVVIAHLLGPYKCSMKRKKSDKTGWTARTNEVLDSFILLHENSSEDPVVNSTCSSKKIEALKAVYNANNLELTAYIIVIGKLDKIESSNVVIGSDSYSIPGQNSLLLSVDICFKCMYALKKSFPKASTLIWSFLASDVYKINKDTDTAISQFVGKLDELIKKKKQIQALNAGRGGGLPAGTITVPSPGGLTIQKPLKAVQLSLTHAFKIFFEIPGVLRQTQAYMKKLYSEEVVVSNVIQASLWNRKYQPGENKDLNRMPVTLAFDDLETGDALGSHAGEQELGALYASLPALPPHLVAKMMNIFLATIFRSKDRVICGNEAVFSKVIDELNNLSDNGITVYVDGKNHDLFFDTCLLVGDNAGMNALVEMNESFVAKYFCRCCRATLNQCRCFTVEHRELLRNQQNYEEDLANRTHGLKGIPCTFNKLREFRWPEDGSMDLMHDFAEGTLKDTIEKVLTSLILVKKTLSLDIVNLRIATFDFGQVERNRPRQLFIDRNSNKTEVGVLKSCSEIKIKQSAAEILCLGRYLGLMIGDLIKNKNDEHWKLYRFVRQVTGVITSPRHTETHVYDMRDKIKEHHEWYNYLYPGLQKAKGHFLTHASRLTLENGPPVRSWAMPFERKHQDLKEVANNTKCKKNTPSTIAIRNQLQLSYNKECHDEEIKSDVDPGIVDTSCNAQLQLRRIIPDLAEEANCKSYINVRICEKMYKEGTVFLADVDDNGPIFAKVHRIYEFHGKLHFHVCTIHVLDFNTYYHAYKVQDNNKPDKLICVDDVPRYGPMLMLKKFDDHFVATKFDI
ncbi:hypothetical protein QAD02_012693 [Eretmocerus hayati]|uniref:Uncharacterized protein n=1 Tax=Eretmocerus hayati TaxID=131215 RepID=A0ACC2P1G6_9HYME|nr:hypothetical protein QAD02_012693 [Eretmocerus hayati]